MLAGLSTWRGTLEVEADRLALRDEEGRPHDVRDLFVSTDSVIAPVLRLTDVGGGLLPHQALEYEDPTHDQKCPRSRAYWTAARRSAHPGQYT